MVYPISNEVSGKIFCSSTAFLDLFHLPIAFSYEPFLETESSAFNPCKERVSKETNLCVCYGRVCSENCERETLRQLARQTGITAQWNTL